GEQLPAHPPRVEEGRSLFGAHQRGGQRGQQVARQARDREGLDLFQVADVLDVVRILARRGLAPRVEDLAEQRLAGGAQRERQYVGVVPPAGAGGGLGVGAQRGANAVHLVRRDRR